VSRVTQKGQVTIPIQMREALGLVTGTVVDFELDGQVVKITRADQAQDRGRRAIDVLRGRAGGELVTDDLLELTRGS
jgi:AbrB family looped-hinge helix DNA binding protein